MDPVLLIVLAASTWILVVVLVVGLCWSASEGDRVTVEDAESVERSGLWILHAERLDSAA